VKAVILKILSLIGFASAGTGLGFGMDTSGSEPWQIVLSLVGMGIAWLLTTKWGFWYLRVKAFLHELSDMLEDDTIEASEIKDLFEAWKTGKIQPDITKETFKPVA
jgi:hypothetical protein